MRKSIYLFSFCLFLISCNVSNDKFLKIENHDTVTRTVNIYTWNETTPSISFSLESKEKKELTIPGPYSMETTTPTRSKIVTRPGTESTVTYSDVIITAILPKLEQFTVLNLLECNLVLKDKTYPSWSITVPASDTATKDAQLYSDEKHAFYVEGSKTENGFTYIEDGTKKVWYMITVTDNTIVIKEP